MIFLEPAKIKKEYKKIENEYSDEDKYCLFLHILGNNGNL